MASEGNILIKNTLENGRDNGSIYTDPFRKDVIINGALLALGELQGIEPPEQVRRQTADTGRRFDLIVHVVVVALPRSNLHCRSFL